VHILIDLSASDFNQELDQSVEPIAGKLAFRSHQMWDVSIENLIPRSPICL